MPLRKDTVGGGLTSFQIPSGRTVLIDNRIGSAPADTTLLALARRGTEEGYTVLSDFLSTDAPEDRPSVPRLHIAILLRPGKHADHAGIIGAMGTLAAAHAIERNSDYKTQIRWLGGIYAEKKYIAEVYSECMLLPSGYLDYLILHASVEISPAHFPTRMTDVVTRVFTSRQIGVADHVAQAMLHDFFIMYDNMKGKEDISHLSFWEEYKRRSLLLGKKVRVRWNGRKRTGLATTVANDGRLSVSFSDGTEIKLSSQSQLLSPR